MADDPFALSTVTPIVTPTSAAEAEYDAICTALMATVRGRWFLQEYSRRTRNTDTRTVLAAIERIESVIQSEHTQQTQQHHRISLLEMARAIARTRAEVATLKSRPAAAARSGEAGSETASAVIAAAQRLHDLAWTMREQGLDTSTTDQIEQLATAILSAASLRNPDDGRAQKLAEVLQYLERRIDTMLDTSADEALEQSVSERPVAVMIEAERDSPQSPDAAGETAVSDERTAEACTSLHDGDANAPTPGPQPADFLLDPLSAPLRTSAALQSETMPPEADLTLSDPARVAPIVAAPRGNDPLAALRAMSDEERIALFT